MHDYLGYCFLYHVLVDGISTGEVLTSLFESNTRMFVSIYYVPNCCFAKVVSST